MVGKHDADVILHLIRETSNMAKEIAQHTKVYVTCALIINIDDINLLTH